MWIQYIAAKNHLTSITTVVKKSKGSEQEVLEINVNTETMPLPKN